MSLFGPTDRRARATARSRRIVAASCVALATAAATALVAAPAEAASGCRVTYTVTSQWGGGFIGDVSITNLGDPVSSWSLAWTFPSGQTVVGGWNAGISQSGASVTARDVGWNAALATGASTAFGFQGSFSGGNDNPSAFTLNGVACTGSTSGGTPTSTTTSAPVTTTTAPWSTTTTTTSRTTTTTTTRTTTTTTRPTTTTTRPTTTTTSSSSGTSPDAPWPNPWTTVQLSGTQKVSGTFDGAGRRYQGWGGDQAEGQDALFDLANGATLKNVVIGNRAGDGVHCAGTCTLINVWWEDVGEDAATLMKSAGSSAVMTIDGGGARYASDKIFQHNGDGTMVIKNFQASDFGKLYRSCGNCSTQYQRDVVVQNVKLTTPAKTVVYINTNYGDVAKLSGLTIVNDPSRKVVVCRWSRGVTSGEPSEIGSGPSNNCQYNPSAVVYR